MHFLEREYRELNATGLADDAATSRAVGADRGTWFSVFDELRFGLYGSVAAITSGIAILIKQNLDRIGPLALMAGLGLIAAGCYAPALRGSLRGDTRGIGGDYLLLLGALILSADVGYAVSRFGASGTWYLLALAILHALTAYALASRLVLSLALASLAAWLGIDSHVDVLLAPRGSVTGYGIRALGCAGIIISWREIHRRLRGAAEFGDVFAHFAANIGFWGALALCLSDDARLFGILGLIALAFASIRHGLSDRQEAFVIYGVAYTALGCCILDMQWIHDGLIATILALAVVLAAVVALWQLRRRVGAESP